MLRPCTSTPDAPKPDRQTEAHRASKPDGGANGHVQQPGRSTANGKRVPAVGLLLAARYWTSAANRATGFA